MTGILFYIWQLTLGQQLIQNCDMFIEADVHYCFSPSENPSFLEKNMLGMKNC